MTSPDPLRNLLGERALQFGDFVLASGARSSYYIDCRRATMSAEGQARIGAAAFQAIREAGLTPDAIGGLTMGADPVSYAIARASWEAGDPVDAFSVRKAAKAHGTGRRIEGCFAERMEVVVIEDVITSGGSALEACRAVEAEGGTVLAVLALVDREGGGRERIEAAGYPVIALYRVSELLGEDGSV